MAWRGQLSRNLKELRILFCQTSPTSSTARSFVEKNYKELKKSNPKLPILIRECRGTEPQLWARYGEDPDKIKQEIGQLLQPFLGMRQSNMIVRDMGVERGVRLEGMSEEQISKALEELNKVGASLKA